MSRFNNIFRLTGRLGHLIPNLGWVQTGMYIMQTIRCALLNETRNYQLWSRNSKFPLICRSNTSDIDVFKQIFVGREYSCFDDLSNVDLVIDCGANVGYSSAYFLTRFPKCNVICVEPDQSNFTMLEKNLAPYKDRVKLIRSGIWSHPTDLKILEVPYGDGREWAVQVRECKPDETPELQAIDIGTLLEESGFNKISILKIDVEGAEAVVFGKNYESWLPFAENIVIELHDDSFFGPASEIVFNTISSCKLFDISKSGELSVFKTRQ